MRHSFLGLNNYYLNYKRGLKYSQEDRWLNEPLHDRAEIEDYQRNMSLIQTRQLTSYICCHE
jgi:hypothetical protein